MVIVNTNPMYTARELDHQFNDSGASTLVVLAELLSPVEPVLAPMPLYHIYGFTMNVVSTR
jgi:long-chain acyl-CoA synthetase